MGFKIVLYSFSAASLTCGLSVDPSLTIVGDCSLRVCPAYTSYTYSWLFGGQSDDKICNWLCYTAMALGATSFQMSMLKVGHCPEAMQEQPQA